jgi:hypothetical protein
MGKPVSLSPEKQKSQSRSNATAGTASFQQKANRKLTVCRGLSKHNSLIGPWLKRLVAVVVGPGAAKQESDASLATETAANTTSR